MPYPLIKVQNQWGHALNCEFQLKIEASIDAQMKWVKKTCQEKIHNPRPDPYGTIEYYLIALSVPDLI